MRQPQLCSMPGRGSRQARRTTLRAVPPRPPLLSIIYSGRRTRGRAWRMAGGECHMMICLCQVKWGGCHEGESSEPMPTLTLGQAAEQSFQRVIRKATI